MPNVPQCLRGEEYPVESVPVIGRRNLVIGYVARDVVTRHDVLHLPLVPANIVVVVLVRVLFPLFVRLIELMLIVGRKPALGIALITTWVAILLRVSGAGDLIKGNVGRDVVARHDVLHLAHIFGDIVTIVLAGIIHPLCVSLVEIVLVVGRKPAGLAKRRYREHGQQRRYL